MNRLIELIRKSNIMDMSIKHKELVEKATSYLKELVPEASDIAFEEIGVSLSLDNPPNAAVVVLSYKDAHSADISGISRLFSKKLKSIHMHPDSGELLAIKNRLG